MCVVVSPVPHCNSNCSPMVEDGAGIYTFTEGLNPLMVGLSALLSVKQGLKASVFSLYPKSWLFRAFFFVSMCVCV